jgi:GNAT superfamily N-acetyltransferase
MGSSFRTATPADAAALLAMVGEFHPLMGISFDPAGTGAAVDELLRDPALGRAWLIESGAELVGYAVVVFDHSLEFRGRLGVLDELYVREAHRGRGVGATALRFVESACRGLGLRALTLEVGRDNLAAQAAYARAGFRARNSDYLFKRLDAE